MTKVHPNVPLECPSTAVHAVDGDRLLVPPTVLTVWRKSLLFSCSGFTVFDSRGNLVFRVDNYDGAAAEVVLMDTVGKPLLTVRRKKLSLAEQWLIYEGEGVGSSMYLVKRNVSFGGQSKTAARVVAVGGAAAEGGYVVEGSYCRRSCVVYDEQQRQVAEIRRKDPAAGGAAFGDDVFRLVVMPEMNAVIAMAFVVVLDLMFKR